MDPKDEKPNGENPEGGGTGDEGGEGGEKPTIESLQKQITDLNKGIAGYRKDAKEGKEAKAELEQLRKELKEAEKEEDEEEEEDSVETSAEDQKKFESWAKKQGYVTKEQLDADKAEAAKNTQASVEANAVSAFLEEHPDMDDDEKWTKIKEEFGQYKTPSTEKGYLKILNKVYKDLFGKSDEEEKGATKARAESSKRSRLSLGGGSQKVDTSKEDDVAKLQEQYPNLTKDQIKARLSEIDDIAKERKEAKKKDKE